MSEMAEGIKEWDLNTGYQEEMHVKYKGTAMLKIKGHSANTSRKLEYCNKSDNVDFKAKTITRFKYSFHNYWGEN